MSLIGRWLGAAQHWWQGSRDAELNWRLARQHNAAEWRKRQALDEAELAAELRKRAQQLAHELTLLETRHQNELAMLKIRCQQDLQDYKHYLAALDKLKISLRQNHAHLPEALAYTLHHHAKQLLNRLWECDEAAEKLKIEMQLLEFMAAVHEDNRNNGHGNGLPRNALALISGGDTPRLYESEPKSAEKTLQSP